jgi:hypothetical protein
MDDNHCLHSKPEYNGLFRSSTHFPFAKLQTEEEEEEEDEN